MYCPNCGKENPDGSKFCNECGMDFYKISQELSDKQQDAADLETQGSSKESKQGFFHKTAGKVLIVIIIAAAIVAAVIAIMCFRSTKGLDKAEDLEDTALQAIEEDGVLIIEPSDIVYDVHSLSKERQNMLGPMDSAAYALTPGGEIYSYDWDNPEYVWEALYCLIVSYRDSLISETGAVSIGDDDHLYVTEDFLKECASAMFADFSGELPSQGMRQFTKEGDLYRLGIGDRGDESSFISSWIEHSDGTCTVETQIWNGDRTELFRTYRFELIKNEYTESEADPYYVYSITSLETIYGSVPIEDTSPPAENDYYILPDSDSRYYTEDELSALTQDELRLARNEIYARHGRKFDSEDLQSYFESQSWYHGTIAPSDFSESMLNEYEKVNVKTIQGLEGGVSSGSTPTQICTYIPIGESCAYDLNGDGIAEEISVLTEYQRKDIGQSYNTFYGLRLIVDGIEGPEIDYGTWMDYCIIDIDSYDGTLQVGIQYGIDDDFTQTTFYSYDSTGIHELGTVGGTFNGPDWQGVNITCSGDGTINTYTRLNVLQTWFAYVTYELRDGELQELIPSVYTPILSSGGAIDLTVLRDLSATINTPIWGDSIVIPAGTKIHLTGTDNSSWVSFTADDYEGTLYFQVSSSGVPCAETGRYEMAWEVLDGLTYYD